MLPFCWVVSSVRELLVTSKIQSVTTSRRRISGPADPALVHRDHNWIGLLTTFLSRKLECQILILQQSVLRVKLLGEIQLESSEFCLLTE